MILYCGSAEIAEIDTLLLCNLQNQLEDDLSFVADKKREKELLADETYGSEFISISVIPMILSPRFSDVYNERKLLRRKEHWADIRLRVDYEKYQNGDDATKRLLLIKNIVDSIRVVDGRKMGDFNGQKLIEDILKKLDLKIEQIDIL